jgi:FAD:protein FMN transferase
VKRTLTILCALCLVWHSGNAQLLEKAQLAFQMASTQHKPIFLIFSGSDWCLPCIRFEKKILADTNFLNFAKQNLVMLRADFPQRKKISAEMIKQNEALADKYNPDGEFPKLVLLNPDESILTSIQFSNQTTGEFVTELTSVLQNAHMFKEYTRKEKLMGSAFEFLVTAETESGGTELLDECVAEVKNLEASLTEFNENSETSLINRNAGIAAVQVSDNTYGLIERSMRISSMTDGAFDITAVVLRKLYNFRGENFKLPDSRQISEALSITGYRNIQLTPPNRVFLTKRKMHIAFGAIGKGYAADKVKSLMISRGVDCGFINASGDLTAWGIRPNGESWKTGIAHPDDHTKILLWMPMNGLSIATSGNYIQYFDHLGRRYSHNIDPRSGYPVSGIKSVSVISPGAELSDALATAVTVMGTKSGLYLINQLPQTHCVIVDENNRVHVSKKITIEHAA